MTEKLRQIFVITLLLLSFVAALAQDNDKILNRPYADMKQLHFGFSIGANFQNLAITNNGYIDPETGESWFADIPENSPGFCVNVLADYRLSDHFNFRLSPGMYFGNKVVKYVNSTASPDAVEPGAVRQSQNIKSTYVVVPVDLKYSSRRYYNVRPYLTAGAMALVDVGKDRPEQLRVKDVDCMLTVGLGCDIYLPFFKLCPELKFCFGVRDMLERDRPDLQDNEQMMKFTHSVSKIKNNMVVLTFYFE